MRSGVSEESALATHRFRGFDHHFYIVGAYGSRMRHEPAFDVWEFMRFSVAGSLSAGPYREARFAWTSGEPCGDRTFP